MAGLDELFAQIPTQEIASKLGVDEGEVNSAIRTLVPALVGGVAENVQANEIDSSELESAVAQQGASGLLDGGVSVDQVDAQQGDQFVARIFGGNDSNAVASALAGTGAGGGDLIKRLLPILAPIVLAYIGKQFAQKSAAPAGGGATQAQASPSGGLGDVLGSILGGAGGGGGNNPLGSILGSVLGGSGGQSNPIGEILGGLLGGKK
jgi:hypothetical protein